jgi:hypothetical protein
LYVNGFGDRDIDIGYNEKIYPASQILSCQNNMQLSLFMDASGIDTIVNIHQFLKPEGISDTRN